MGSTLTAIIFLNFGVAAKMALEIYGYALWAGGRGAIFWAINRDGTTYGFGYINFFEFPPKHFF